MDALVAPIARAACDSEALPDAGLKGTLADLGKAIGLRDSDADDAKVKASAGARRASGHGNPQVTDRLIAIHGLEGHASQDIRERLSGVELDAPVNEGKAAMMGGVVSGALTGLAADLAAGGFTFGAGMLTGAVLGALGGAGIARGMNLARGRTGATLRWDDALLQGLVASALLRYLAVAHYGRGRGEWIETEYPPFWGPLVARIVEEHADRLANLWAQREPVCDAAILASGLSSLLADVTRGALEQLYPGTLEARTRTATGRNGATAG